MAAPAPAPVPPAPPAPTAPNPRLQAPPIDVAVPANSPAAANATPILVVPPVAVPAPPPAVRPALPPAPVLAYPPPLPTLQGPYRVQPQRSLSEMANEQLRRGRPRDPLDRAMEGAAIDDCLHGPTNTPTVGGLLAAPGLAARALSGRCAK